jgi:glycosyltransferase involved in cell wall biosynthesis
MATTLPPDARLQEHAFRATPVHSRSAAGPVVRRTGHLVPESETAVKVSVITACRNSGRLVDMTIRSVRNQTALRSGAVELEYIIIDGASNDSTARRLRKNRAPGIHVVSEPDSGFYHALGKGLRRATGDWISYLNAGDLYAEDAFETVLQMAQHPEVKWVTGVTRKLSSEGRVLRSFLPFRYRRELILAGTFWRRELNDLIDLERLAEFRLAGDYYLWTCFAPHCEPTIVDRNLGSFRKHAGQLSENLCGYHQEVASIAGPLRITDAALAAFDAVMGLAPRRLKKKLNPRHLLVFDPETGSWR